MEEGGRGLFTCYLFVVGGVTGIYKFVMRQREQKREADEGGAR